MPAISTFWPSLVLSVVVMSGLWFLSVRRRDASLVDLWWGPGFAAAALLAWLGAGAPLDARALLILALVGLWAARLLRTMLGRRAAHPGEDPRYTAIRESWGASFWWKSLFIVFLLQALLQWIVALAPMSAATGLGAPIGGLGALGAVLAVGGLWVETKADAELDAHKRGPSAGAVCDTGLRAFVRYPNYSGEMAVWWGVWLIAAEGGAVWTIVSPVLLTLLLVKVSGAPMLEERLRDGRPGYAEWRERTPAFAPRLSDLARRFRVGAPQ